MRNQHAFPTSQIADSDGMTLRDYFAAKAMQGLFASGHYEGNTNITTMAESSYKIADAMLKAREA